jgi:hypothetical protein
MCLCRKKYIIITGGLLHYIYFQSGNFNYHHKKRMNQGFMKFS